MVLVATQVVNDRFLSDQGRIDLFVAVAITVARADAELTKRFWPMRIVARSRLRDTAGLVPVFMSRKQPVP